MHKKLEAELVSLAHQILEMKNKGDIALLRDKAKDVYEKLIVLTYIDEYFLTTSNTKENREELINKLKGESLKKKKPEVKVKEIEVQTKKKQKKQTTKTIKLKEDVAVDNLAEIETKKELKKRANKIAKDKEAAASKKVIEIQNKKDTKKIEKQTAATLKLEVRGIVNKIQKQEPTIFYKKEEVVEEKTSRKTLEEELKDSIPVDVAANMFEKAKKLDIPKEIKLVSETSFKKPKPIAPKVNIATKRRYVIPKPPPKAKSKPIFKSRTVAKTSLNDRLFQQRLQVGLNDRIAFVKHLFNFSQEEFNQVLSQLNTFKTEAEAKNYIINTVKPKYDWNDKEEYIDRLYILIERKFL